MTETGERRRAGPTADPRALLIPIVLLLLTACGGGEEPVEEEEYKPTETEEEFLNDLEQRCYDYFHNETNLDMGLTRDRAPNFRSTPEGYSPATIAGTGYTLAAYIIGAERGFIPLTEARARTLWTLQKHRDEIENVHGFYYHFLDYRTGERYRNSEVSSIDTVLALAGMIAAREYYGDDEISGIVDEIYERIDWEWMLNGDETLSMGWTPEDGFIEYRWDHYSECLLMYILAMGSPTHPLNPSSWDAISRPVGEYGGHVCFVSPPLFTHQYPAMYIDFSGIHDRYGGYFESSREATFANRQFCIDQSSAFGTYGENSWGLTACQAPRGYEAYGAPPGAAHHDGTVAPTAAGGSLIFTPRESLDALIWMRDNLGDTLWGRYGPADAYNLDEGWTSSDVLAIDQGTILIMAENLRTGLIQDLFMQNEAVRRGLAAAGFEEGEISLRDRPIIRYADYRARERPSASAPRIEGIVMDGNLADWSGPGAPAPAGIDLSGEDSLERGAYLGEDDIGGRILVAYDDDALKMAAIVRDNQVRCRRPAGEAYENDCIEIYIDPAGDGLAWGSPGDFQIVISPSGPGGEPLLAMPFQGEADPSVEYASAGVEGGYVIEASIPWTTLGLEPGEGLSIGFSPAIHDDDRDGTNNAKLNWYFMDPGITLGSLVLGEGAGGSGGERESGGSGGERSDADGASWFERVEDGEVPADSLPGPLSEDPVEVAAPEGRLVIASFDTRRRINDLGGAFDVWDKDPGDPSQTCTLDFSAGNRMGEMGYSLKLSYDVDSPNPAYNGLWIRLADLDPEPYDTLVLHVAGDGEAGYTRRLKIELKGPGNAPAGHVYIDGIDEEWREFEIPLSAFENLSSVGGLEQLVIVFEDRVSEPKTGIIFLDDIYLE